MDTEQSKEVSMPNRHTRRAQVAVERGRNQFNLKRRAKDQAYTAMLSRQRKIARNVARVQLRKQERELAKKENRPVVYSQVRVTQKNSRRAINKINNINRYGKKDN